MGLFKNRQAEQNVSPRQQLAARYASSRHSILCVVIFTVINVVLLMADGSSYFLFSAFFPYLYAAFGLGGDTASLVIAVVVLAALLLCWLLSKNGKVVWLYAALALMVLDTAYLYYIMGTSADWIIDYVFHAWVIGSLISGVLAYHKLQKLPAEDSPEIGAANPVEE